MPLTYQPFAETPEVDELREELAMNVPDSERLICAAAGTTLLGMGISQRGLGRWLLFLLAGGLVHRAITGRCPAYQRLGLNHRHPAAGVPGNRGTKIEESIEINCPAEKLYSFWRNFEQLPRIMRHLHSVKETGGNRSRWKVEGPAGHIVEWDAEIVNEHEGTMIAWQSLPGSEVSNAGSVWFERTLNGATRVKVALEFDPPAGALGTAIAELLGSSPGDDLREDLNRFKQFAEQELV